MNAAEKIALWRRDPVQFVRDSFQVEPDAWQVDALNAAAQPGTQRVALRACAGPGKTAVLAWLGWWFLSTHCGKGEHPKGIAVGVTADSLRDNLWPELAKWQQRSKFLSLMFTWQKERIFCNESPETWFLSARSFSKTANAEEQGRVLSGLHSQFPLVLLDETGDMNPSIGRAAEQALGNCIKGLVVQAGNPTNTSGLLYDSCVVRRDKWSVVRITGDPDDPKRSPRVGVEWARSEIEKNGRDNPWVMAYILGEFPKSGFNTLLSSEEVESALGRHARVESFGFAPCVIGCDVARFGDDRTAIWRRQGRATWTPDIMRGARTEEIAGRVALQVSSDAMGHPFRSDGIMVDGSGGYGGGVVDALRLAGHQPIEVQFGGAADDERFANKRAEMWWRMAEWVKRDGCLPQMSELVRELSSTQYYLDGRGKLALESKDQVKKRLGFSPDLADGLALTFAVILPPKNLNVKPSYAMQPIAKPYDPLRRR